MGKASLTIAIGGEYKGSAAIKKAEAELRALREAARHAGGGASDIMKIGDSLVDLGSSMELQGQRIEAFGTKLTRLTAPIAAVGAASVKLASDYEDSIAKVYTIMDKGAMSTKEMSQNILDLSTETGKSATELAEATYQALSASVATDKAAGFVSDAVKLAKVGFTDTTSAVDVLTTTINAYGYSADDAEMITGRLVQTQNKGKTTVNELAQSIGNVIPTASAYNVSLDNLCSAYVVMTKQGINTANATTAINGMLTELANEGSDVAKILKDKTGKSFGQLMADGMSLGQVLEILNDSVNGDSEAFANLWGNVRASKGALALANAGAEGFAQAMDDMANSAGLVESALDDLSTPSAKAGKAINALKNTAIELGQEILGAALPTLEQLSGMAKDLYNWFGSLDSGVKQNIVTWGALAVSAGPVITIFGKMYSGVGRLISSIGRGVQGVGTFAGAMKTAEAEMRAAGATSVSLGTKMKAAATQTGLLTKATGLLKGSLAMLGVGAVIAVIGTLVGKFMEWKEHNDKVEKATRGLEDAVGAAKVAYDGYTPSIDGATKALEGNAISAGEALDAQAALADKMNETWKDVGTDAAMVDSYANTIAELGSKGYLTHEDMVRLRTAVDGFNQITGSSIEITNELTGELNTGKDAILGIAEAYKEEARAAAAREMLVEVNKQMIQDEIALKNAKDTLAAAEAEYQYQLENYPDAAYSYGQAVVDAQQKVNEMEAALDSARKSEEDLVGVLSESPSHFKTVEDALSSCGLSIESLGDLTDEELAQIRESFDGTLASVADACQKQGREIPESLADGMKSTSSQPEKRVQAISKYIQSNLEKLPDKLKKSGAASVVKMAAGMLEKTPSVATAAGKLFTTANNGVSQMPSRYGTVGTTSAQNLGAGLSSMTGVVSNGAAAILATAVNGVKSAPGQYKTTGVSAGSSFSGGISSVSAYGSGQHVAQTGKSGMASVSAWGTGANFSDGFASGIYASASRAMAAARSVAYNALYAIKDALGVASPSKEAMKVGGFFVEGAVVGMRNMEGALIRQTNRLGDIMTLEPTGYGTYAPYWAGTSHAGGNVMQGSVTMNVTVNVNAASAEDGREVGTSLADALYEELSREMGSSLWPASYSTA